MSGWELVLIRLVVLPMLRSLADFCALRAKKTPNKSDDIAAGIFQSAVAFLEDPTILVKIGEKK